MIAAAVRVAVHVLLTMLGAAPVGAEPAQPVQRQVSAMPDVGQLIKRTYVSPVDGAELEYAAWLPPQYEQRQDWPLIVFLHGSGEGEDWAAPTKPQASIPVLDTQKSLPFVVVFPLMRGSWSINALAQCDVLDVLADAQANLHVDADRVHLVGLSLGGFTAWRIATAHPDLFATLTLLCAGGDAALAGNVRNLPIRIYQGARDPVVPVALARELRAALGKVRADVQYVEFPEGDHIIWRGPLASEDLYRWMAQHRRPQQPQRVTYRTVLPRYHRAYWVDVVARRRADLPAFVDAIIAPGTGAVVVHAENMARLDLRPPAGLIGAGTPTFFLDGERVDAQAIEGGWRIELEPVAEEGLRKWPGLAGPIQDVLLGPFVVAIAADENGEQIPAWQLAAHEGFAWTQRLVAHRIRSIPANEVIEELEQHVNLICFGDESNHPLLAALADQLPLRCDGTQILLHGQALPDDRAAFVYIYPNPRVPGRYIVVCSGAPDLLRLAAVAALTPPALHPTPEEDLVWVNGQGQFVGAEGVWHGQDWSEIGKGQPLRPRRGFLFDEQWRLSPAAVERLRPSENH